MSEIRANTVSNAAGTGPATLTGQYAAKAWVNFNGTGTVAIRESGNVSSITDNGTGDYTVNFTTAMTDANYSLGYGLSGSISATSYAFTLNNTNLTKSATEFRFLTGQNRSDTNFSKVDVAGCYLQFFR